jgi:hypothetical protein
MTKERFPVSNQIVEVQNILEREPSQRLEWLNEFSVRKNKIEFRKSGYNAFKLPANLYDPDGNASKDGARTKLNPRKGVWLCSYQMRMQYGLGSGVVRDTGFVREFLDDNAISSSHFNANRCAGYLFDAALESSVDESIGSFPYERPWTINYPEPYKIPSRPKKKNTTKDFSNKVEPRYLDGDMAGEWYTPNTDSSAKGYGTFVPLDFGDLIYNEFAQSVTKSRIYKYEQNVSWHEEYSNGYRDFFHKQLFPNKKFTVENGEKYQRVEAGFGYWLKPEGWGRISQETWGDFMVTTDIIPGGENPANFEPPSYEGAIFRNGEVLYSKFDANISPSWLREGSLDIYRIIDDNPENLEEPVPPLQKKASQLSIPICIRNNRKAPNVKVKLEAGNNERRITICSDTKVEVENIGLITGEVTVNGVKKSILAREKQVFDLNGGGFIKMTTNADFNFVDNFYEKSFYKLKFITNEINKSSTKYRYLTFNQVGGTYAEPTNYYFTSEIRRGRYKINKKGECRNRPNRVGTYKMNGLLLHDTSSSVVLRAEEEPNVGTCENDLSISFSRLDLD